MTIPQYEHFFQAFNEYAEIVRERANRPEHVMLANMAEKLAIAAHDLNAVWEGRCLAGYELAAIAQLTGTATMDSATREYVRMAVERVTRTLAEL
jgi:hypothetical protein